MPLTESKYIWMDGEFIPWKEAKIHILSHVIHYGSAVFEGIRCYKTEKGPAIFRLKEHIDRLYFSA
ncbi:MAG: branched chain amino acid aminotransferase, partial [Candidatus Baldrarchaeia archaeon]